MKKVVSTLLAAVLAIGMTATAFAANPKITSQIAAIADADVGERGPGYKIWLPLTRDSFDGATEDLTMADVKASKITVKQTTKSGAKAIGSVEIKEGTGKVANILVTLAEPYTSTKPLDFEITLTLSINGSKQDYQTIVAGTLSNGEEIVYSDTDYVDLSDGRTAKCEESAKKVEVYIGNDISIFVNMVKGKEYYGVATRKTDADDDEILSEYPDISDVYVLTTIGLNGSGNNVKFDSQDRYYVYSKLLEYLGTTSDMLPYSTKYYLSSTKLDIPDISDGAEDEPEDLGDAGDKPEENFEDPDMLNAVDTTNANNGKANPDTGLDPLFYVAVAAAALSLTAMTAISLKKRK